MAEAADRARRSTEVVVGNDEPASCCPSGAPPVLEAGAELVERTDASVRHERAVVVARGRERLEQDHVLARLDLGC